MIQLYYRNAKCIIFKFSLHNCCFHVQKFVFCFELFECILESIRVRRCVNSLFTCRNINQEINTTNTCLIEPAAPGQGQSPRDQVQFSTNVDRQFSNYYFSRLNLFFSLYVSFQVLQCRCFCQSEIMPISFFNAL